MDEVEAVFFDIGGVLLTNGWDHRSRAAAAARFGFDAADVERRHAAVVDVFERGRMGLDGYLAATVFHQPRTFTAAEFQAFMFARSESLQGLAAARDIARAGRYFLVALNNESREVHEHRVARFDLRAVFDLFLTSCYTGLRKPEPAAFRYALDLTQVPAERCVFVDDRPENVAAAQTAGMRAVVRQGPGGLREELRRAGVAVDLEEPPWNSA